MQAVCRKLLATGDDEKKAAEALCDLLRACRSPGFEMAARACREAFVPWLFDVVLRNEEADWVSPPLAA